MRRFYVKHDPANDRFIVYRRIWLSEQYCKAFYYPAKATLTDMQEAKINAYTYLSNIELVE